MSLPILGPSLGNPDDAADIAITRGGYQPHKITRYARQLWKRGEELGVRADVAFGQADLETGDRSSGIGFQSRRWVEEGNPAGISITNDKPDSESGPIFSPETWADIHIVHLAGYAGIDPGPELRALDIRWDAMIEAGYFGVAETVDDLDQRWAWDPRGSQDYGGAIEDRWQRYTFPKMDAYRPDAGDGDNEQEAPMAEQKRFVIAMGHRNTDRGGAYNEINWTPGCARAIRDAIEARGGKAVIVQEHDSDNDPNWYPGGLQAMARHAVTLAGQYGPFEAYISCHYNGGAGPGFHAIFPDAWSGVDQKANNPIDVRLCENLVAAVRSTNTVSILSWTRHAPGVMSERESGVGAQGYRLGELYGSIGFRDRTARVIIEAGSIDVARERAYINDPHWLRHVYAEAIADGLEATFGKLGTKPTEPPIDDDEHVIHIGDTIRTTVNLRLRQGPHLNAPTVMMLPPGTEAVVNGAWSQADGYGWLPVETAHGSGFVATAGTDGPYVELVKRADPPTEPEPEPEPEYVAAKPIPALLDTDLSKYDTAEGITTDVREQDFVFVSDVIEFTAETVAGEYAVKNPRKVKANYQPGDRAVAAWLVRSQDTNSWWYVLAHDDNEWVRVPFENTRRIGDSIDLGGDVDADAAAEPEAA